MPLIPGSPLPPIAAAILATTICSSLTAQTVRGTLVDSASSQPLASASIELTGADSQLVARASSDGAGKFLLEAPAPGGYRVRVQRIGYRVYESAMVLNSRGETNLTIPLAAVAVELPPVTVEAVQDGYLLNRGFYMRKTSERGTFLDPAAVEKLATKAKLATDILVRIPGVRIYQGAPQLRTCRTVTQTSSEGAMDITGYPHIYIDGVMGGTEIMWSLQPNDILAVEVYMGPSQVPLVYGGTSTPCGVILIWTKH